MLRGSTFGRGALRRWLALHLWPDHVLQIRSWNATEQLVASPAERRQERSAFARFLFSVRRTEDGVQLQDQEGSAWSTLRFTCPPSGCDQAIDQLRTFGSPER